MNFGRQVDLSPCALVESLTGLDERLEITQTGYGYREYPTPLPSILAEHKDRTDQPSLPDLGNAVPRRSHSADASSKASRYLL